MLEFLIIVLSVFFLLFIGIVVVGAPYVPSKRIHIGDALTLLDLKNNQLLVELGCGDGRVLRAAAEKGLRARGYELNLLLFIVAYFKCWRYRKNVKVIWGNYWYADLSDADGVFVFSADIYMKRLDRKIIRADKPIKLASLGFKIPDKKPVRKKGAVYLYNYGSNT